MYHGWRHGFLRLKPCKDIVIANTKEFSYISCHWVTEYIVFTKKMFREFVFSHLILFKIFYCSWFTCCVNLSTPAKWFSYTPHTHTHTHTHIHRHIYTWETWVGKIPWRRYRLPTPHSSTLAWRIPWTVQSMGLQRVKHDWMTFIYICTIYRYTIIGKNIYILSHYGL